MSRNMSRNMLTNLSRKMRHISQKETSLDETIKMYMLAVGVLFLQRAR